MNVPELEVDIAEIAKTRGKMVAIQEYRQRTSKSLRKCRRDVELILWRRGIRSMTPPRFQFPEYINWYRVLLFGIPAILGLGLAAVLIYLNRMVFGS